MLAARGDTAFMLAAWGDTANNYNSPSLKGSQSIRSEAEDVKEKRV